MNKINHSEDFRLSEIKQHVRGVVKNYTSPSSLKHRKQSLHQLIDSIVLERYKELGVKEPRKSSPRLVLLSRV